MPVPDPKCFTEVSTWWFPVSVYVLGCVVICTALIAVILINVVDIKLDEWKNTLGTSYRVLEIDSHFIVERRLRWWPFWLRVTWKRPRLDYGNSGEVDCDFAYSAEEAFARMEKCAKDDLEAWQRRRLPRVKVVKELP